MRPRGADIMNDEQFNLGALIRAGADDELSDEQRRQLDVHLEAHPEDQARIDFERRLRDATSRVMGQVATPPGLRERIQARLEAPAPKRLRIPVSVLAGAASIVIVAGVLAVLLSPTGPLSSESRYRATVVSYLDHEHKRCWVDTDQILRKFTVRQRADLPGVVDDLLHQPVSLQEIEHAELSGLRFIAAGECNMPGQQPSVHIGFETTGEEHVPVSLFMQPAREHWDVEENVTYALTNERRIARGVCTIYMWKRDGILHFLVADDMRACDMMREALGAPQTLRQL